MKKRGYVVLLITMLIVIYGRVIFKNQFIAEPIVAGAGVSSQKQLSDYLPALVGTAGDTEIYVLEGEKAGGTVLILGGTHPNEPASMLTATVLIENMLVEAGRVLIIPRANNSGFTHNGPQEGHPNRFTIPTSNGERWFRFGDRVTNPIHQWPDPDIYNHSSGETLAGVESRNLNRAYPGNPDGTLTEKIAYAIMQLLVQENVGLAIDMHEASPEYPVVNALVAHEKAMNVAAIVALELQFDGINISLEPSPHNLRGLSHREWGDHTQALSVLLETANPSMGRIRGRTDEALVVTGKDPVYHKASKLGVLSVEVPEEGLPIELRVARHLAAIEKLIEAYGFMGVEPVEVTNIPAYDQVLTKGVGFFLQHVQE